MNREANDDGSAATQSHADRLKFCAEHFGTLVLWYESNESSRAFTEITFGINGDDIGAIRRGKSIRYLLLAGEHRIVIRNSLYGPRPSRVEFSIVAGSETHITCKAKFPRLLSAIPAFGFAVYSSIYRAFVPWSATPSDHWLLILLAKAGIFLLLSYATLRIACFYFASFETNVERTPISEIQESGSP